MAKNRCLILLTYLAVLSGGVLAGALLLERSGEQQRGETELSGDHFTVDHVRRTTEKPFGDMSTAMARTLRLLPRDAWQRTAVHSEAGLVTLRHLLLHAINHLRHHLRFVVEKRAAMTIP